MSGVKFGFLIFFFFLRILSLTHCLVAEKMWEKRESFDFVFIFGIFSICVNIFGHNCLMMLLCCAYELLYLIWVFWFHYAFFFLQWHFIVALDVLIVWLLLSRACDLDLGLWVLLIFIGGVMNLMLLEDFEFGMSCMMC
jgi:hypothetical protein